jgi:hypothetical protein
MDTTEQMDEIELKKLKRKLYHKEYYAKNKSVWNKYKEEKQLPVQEDDNITLSYYERNKEQKKEYQRKRYEEKKKGIIKQKSPEDQLIETLYKIYQDSKKEKNI